MENVTKSFVGRHGLAEATYGYVIFNESGLGQYDERDDLIHLNRAKVVSQYVLPAIFIFGGVGNALCVAVFARKLLANCSSRFGLRDNIELSAASGFFLLALSDLLLCISGLPESFLSKGGHADPSNIAEVARLHVRVIQPVLLNVWIFTSTWITCALSIERYFVISYPLQAKSRCSATLTAASGFGIFVASLALNFPYFFKYGVHCEEADCYLMPSKFLLNSTSSLAYHIVWSLFGCVVPFCVLSFCNIRLLIALRRNTSMSPFGVKETKGVGQGSEIGGAVLSRRHDKNGGRRARQVTLILALIVSSYLILVTPASCLELVRPFLPRAQLNWYRLAVVITNLTQAAHFSLAFLLYACMSTRFRRDVGRMASTYLKIRGRSFRGVEASSAYMLVSMTETHARSVLTSVATTRKHSNCSNLRVSPNLSPLPRPKSEPFLAYSARNQTRLSRDEQSFVLPLTEHGSRLNIL